jgi:TolA-binding protein
MLKSVVQPILGVIPVRSILEKAIVHLLNGDQDKAETLFHKFMVEKARSIHETLRQGEDVELKENWDSEISEEEYFDDTDLDDEGEAEDSVPGEVGDADAPVVGDEMGGEGEGLGGDEFGSEEVGDEVGDEGLGDELGGEEGGLEDKIDNLEGKIDELTAEFDRLMAKMEDSEGELGDELGDELGADDDLGIEDEGDDSLDALGSEEGFGDPEMGGEDTDDIADRMEDDMGDEKQPEHEMAEDTEMLEDITESVLAELDKIAAPSNSEGKEIGSGGKTVSGKKDSMLPNHSVNDRWQQAKPVLVKAQGDAHNDSFERETAPSNKTVTSRRNNNAGVKKLKTVPKNGDTSALINKDFAGGHPATKPIIDGKKSSK